MPDKAQDDDLVISLVELALAKSPQEREQYLQDACGQDSDLFGKVWSYVQWEQRMSGFLLEPLYPPPADEKRFEPGELLDQRFRIVREIAHGGMGVVYQAHDEKLGRPIAIKCARPGFGKRLPPEVRHASAISHPNVCKIFEIHTALVSGAETDFITMEFLEGETLTERLLRGRLASEEALLIARQLCAGLAEAHLNNVVHGDLKSSNVIVTKGPDEAVRAVITDFGLARRPEATERVTLSGNPAGGTPDYMAPELWKGEKPSKASDVYALGVILCELASGRKPEEPLLPLGQKWDAVVGRCLDPDPARRFRNGAEVAQALTPARPRRWFLAAAAAVVVASATGLVTYERTAVPRETVRLAILPFDSSPDIRELANGLIGEAAGQIGKLKGGIHTKLTVFTPDEARRKNVDTAEQAKALLGATHGLHGTLTREQNKTILQAYVIDTRTLAHGKEWKAEYSPGEVRYIPVALAGMVTESFRLPAMATSATVNAAARADYGAGLQYIQRNSTVDAGLALLEKAVAADPDSPLTWAAQAEAEWWKFSITRDQLWLHRSAESLRQAQQRNQDLAQVHRVAGLHKREAGWYEQAAAEYRRAIELDPSNGDAYRRLGSAYESNNQGEEARVAYLRAIELDPKNYRNHQSLGNFYDNQGNYGVAEQHYRRVVELAPEEPTAHFLLGRIYLYLGRYSEAEHELVVSLRLGETSTALNTLGVVLMYQGRDRESIPYISRALNNWPERYIWWMNLGVAYRRVGLPEKSERANKRGLALAEAEITKNPRDGYVRSCLAYFYARLGDARRAEFEIAQALQQSPEDADARFEAVKTYEVLNQRENTLRVLSASPPQVLEDVSRFPDLADLRKDSRFLELLASHHFK